MADSTFADPDVTTFARLDGLGLLVVGQFIEPDRAILQCRVVDTDHRCRRCGDPGRARDSTTPRLAHEPLGWRPTLLLVTVRRYRCDGCGHVWRQATSRAAQPRAQLSRGALRWALEVFVSQHLTVARVAEALGVSWNTANSAVLAEGRKVLIADPHRFDGVKVIGVDEHVWRHTRRGDKYVTVIIDLSPVRDRTGPARLPDMVDGRSTQVFKTWLGSSDQTWRKQVEVVAMDGFTGFKTATVEELPDAVAVMDPFHVVRLAGDALDRCRRRVQQQLHGHRGLRDGPLYKTRRALHTGADLLTDEQKSRIEKLFATDDHIQVEITWNVYQRMISGYRDPDRTSGKTTLHTLIDSIRTGVPQHSSRSDGSAAPCTAELSTSWPSSTGPGTSNGPTEAINGRLEHLRGSALGFRNLTNYIARSLLEAGGFRPVLHPQLR